MIIKNGTVNRGSIFLRAISVIQVSNTKQINFIQRDKEDARDCSDKDLKSLGLSEKGHIICLKCLSLDITKVKFSIEDFFSKCEQTCSFLRQIAVLEADNSKSHDSSLPMKITKKELAISVKKKVEQINHQQVQTEQTMKRSLFFLDG